MMSMKKLAILHVVSHHGNGFNLTTYMDNQNVPPYERDGNNPTIHAANVNVTLGGAMVGGIILSVVAMCYCCHKGARKRDNEDLEAQAYRFRYSSTALPLHIYTVEGHQFCETEDLVLNLGDVGDTPTPSPPPEYEAVVGASFEKEEDMETSFIQWREQLMPLRNIRGFDTDDSGLPSYDAAIKLGEPTAGHL